MLAEELLRAKRHPLGLGMTVQVVLTEVGPIVRRAIFTRNHHDAAAESFFAQRLGGSITGRTRADDDKLPRIRSHVAPRHIWRASILCLFRNAQEDLLTFNAHVVTDQAVKRRRFFEIAVDDIENCVVPGANETSAAERSFGEWGSVVGACRANCMEVIADSRQQNAPVSDSDFFHFAVAQVRYRRDLKVITTHFFVRPR